MSSVLRRLSEVIVLLLAFTPTNHRQSTSVAQQQNDSTTLTAQQRAIKVIITTGGGPFGPVNKQFHVGKRVPVTISMENTSDQPTQVCVSSTQYQDMPRLSKDGQLVEIRDEQLGILRSVVSNKTCESFNLPDMRTLAPGQSQVVDWFILSKGKLLLEDVAWYDQLQIGKYDLVIQRRFGCCAGPMVESNKISFEVVP